MAQKDNSVAEHVHGTGLVSGGASQLELVIRTYFFCRINCFETFVRLVVAARFRRFVLTGEVFLAS